MPLAIVRRDALAALVAAGASCFAAVVGATAASARPLDAQPYGAPAGSPRVDGIHVGASAGVQRSRILGDGIRDDVGPVRQMLTARWGFLPRVAVATGLGSTTADFSGAMVKIAHFDALLQYQMARGFLLFPYVEAGLSRSTWEVTSDATDDARVDWLPTVGVGLRRGVGPNLTFTTGARLARGNVRRLRIDGDDTPTEPMRVETTRWLMGIEWRPDRSPRPFEFGVGTQRVSTRGLALSVATMHAETGDIEDTWMGAGSSLGASWGITDHVAVLARFTKSRTRLEHDAIVLRHRDLGLRVGPRAHLRAARPYVEIGHTTIDKRFDGLRDRRAAPFLGAGLLYAFQRDLDVDLGIDGTLERRVPFAEPMYAHYSTVRVRFGFEYRPAR